MKLQTKLIGLALLAAALCAPATMAANQPNAGNGVAMNPLAPDIRMTDPRAPGPLATIGRSPDTQDAALQAQTPTAEYIPFVTDFPRAGAATSQSIPRVGNGVFGPAVPTPSGPLTIGPKAVGRSPDTQDAALMAHSPVATVVKGGTFDWGDAGIGAAIAFGLTLLMVGGTLMVLRRRVQQRGGAPAPTPAS